MSITSPTPEEIHRLEQMWGRAEEVVGNLVGAVQHDVPIVNGMTGLSDASNTFGYIYTFITDRVKRGEINFVSIVAAGALTKLARASRVYDDILAQLDKEMNQ